MGSIYPHKHDNAAHIFEDADGKLWVSHADLLADDYECLEDFSIVYLNEKFYELQGYVQKANAWWIEAVQMEEGVIENALPEKEEDQSP